MSYYPKTLFIFYENRFEVQATHESFMNRPLHLRSLEDSLLATILLCVSVVVVLLLNMPARL